MDILSDQRAFEQRLRQLAVEKAETELKRAKVDLECAEIFRDAAKKAADRSERDERAATKWSD
jgi:hypothetical protein